MFIKELSIYIKFINDKFNEMKATITKSQEDYLFTFIENLNRGIDYYYDLFSSLKNNFIEIKSKLLSDLDFHRNKLNIIYTDILEVSSAK